jgi:hypothetical protein
MTIYSKKSKLIAEVLIMADEDLKYPWESKTLWLSFIGAIYGLAVSFEYIPKIDAGLFLNISTLLFILIMIVRKRGGGKIVILK